MEKEIKIIVGIIVLLFCGVVALVIFGSDDQLMEGVIDHEEVQVIADRDRFINSSDWYTYTSEEYAYEMRYPIEWEFNLIDGTAFHPELCARNKYDKCIGRVTVGVYSDVDENNETVRLDDKCSNIEQVTLRYISGDVWACEEVMSDEFLQSQGYDRKRVYYFNDKRGSVFEVNIMYLHGESILTEKEMVQTIKLRGQV